MKRNRNKKKKSTKKKTGRNDVFVRKFLLASTHSELVCMCFSSNKYKMKKNKIECTHWYLMWMSWMTCTITKHTHTHTQKSNYEPEKKLLYSKCTHTHTHKFTNKHAHGCVYMMEK